MTKKDFVRTWVAIDAFEKVSEGLVKMFKDVPEVVSAHLAFEGAFSKLKFDLNSDPNKVNEDYADELYEQLRNIQNTVHEAYSELMYREAHTTTEHQNTLSDLIPAFAIAVIKAIETDLEVAALEKSFEEEDEDDSC
jgi:hypothetical protein